MDHPRHDVIIAGAGPVGAAFAIALGGSGLDVAVLEARPDAAATDDDRTLAVSYGARLILERLGAWAGAAPATPILGIHVSQRGGYGRSLLEARDTPWPALGYVLRYAGLQRSLGNLLAQHDVTLLTGTRVEAIEPADDAVAVKLDHGGAAGERHAKLLVVADGGIHLGEQAGAINRTRDYGQQALVCTVAASLPHANRAYERFTADGPVALLPFEDRYALIWTASPQEAERLAALPGDAFLATLQAHFGDRAGRFSAPGPRKRFPLALRYALDPVLGRTVLLGNAAQALHPIAGQGFNLGLRDAWELADAIRGHGRSDPGASAVLQRYRSARRLDRMGGIAFTDSLVRTFSAGGGPLQALRGGALALLDLAPGAKRAFVQRMIFGASL
jgi:2-octaprenyl-6-methoxyphenol hydroxylase